MRRYPFFDCTPHLSFFVAFFHLLRIYVENIFAPKKGQKQENKLHKPNCIPKYDIETVY